MSKTSKADFKYFRAKCEEVIDELSLRDWKFYFSHADVDEAYAWVRPDSQAKQATVGLSVDWTGTKVTKEMLTYCAKHEILHVLLADLVNIGKNRTSTAQEFETAQHAIIRRLENWA